MKTQPRQSGQSVGAPKDAPPQVALTTVTALVDLAFETGFLIKAIAILSKDPILLGRVLDWINRQLGLSGTKVAR